MKIRRPGFTLSELVVTTTVFGICVVIAMGTFIAVLKRSDHTERTTESHQELRYSVSLLSRSIRTAPRLPEISDDGRTLRVPAVNSGVLTKGPAVSGGNMSYKEDMAHIQGWRANQQSIKLSPHIPEDQLEGTGVMESIFADSNNFPAGAVASTTEGYFKPPPSGTGAYNLNTMLFRGMSLTIPADPPYTPTPVTITIAPDSNSISPQTGDGEKSLSLTGNLGSFIRNGARISLPSTAPMRMFTIEENGDLRYYPNAADPTRFRVIAHHINPTPLGFDGEETRPFAFGANNREIIMNLERLPPGRVSGRTAAAMRTRAYARTDPVFANN